MSKNKGYNSVFFITTLSVYLGLVLAGASPSVVAQQALLSQRFDIKNEVDHDDDPGKQPTDEINNLVRSIGGYLEELEDFVGALQELHRIEKFDLDRDAFQIENRRLSPVTLGISGINAGYGRSDLIAEPAFVMDAAQTAGLIAARPDVSKSLYEVDEAGMTAQKISRNTTFKADNNQVLVITRLPRGSLDLLVISERQAK